MKIENYIFQGGFLKITFCGAAKRVTGSNFLVETDKTKFLVDCGLFQGDESATRQNWQEFIYDPKQIDFALITHSHIDHIGRLPLFYKRGFRGKVYATEPTAEFSRIFLEDTCHILGDKAKELKLPEIYTNSDVVNTCKFFSPQEYYQEFSPTPDVKIKFYDAGHILGSAIIEIKTEGKTIIFSGDLGNPPVPILRDTDFIAKADYVVMESTYGNRSHEPFEERRLLLERAVEKAAKNNGALLLPSFAMERTQEIIYEFNELIQNNRIPKIPIFVDSPLALKATEIYKKYPKYFDKEAKEAIRQGINFFHFPNLNFVESSNQSKAIDSTPGAKIIIAGSGMSTGGRILYHEKRYLSEPTTMLLIIGFQVKGTLGRYLQEGAKEVEILGEKVAVNAEVKSMDSYSAHADLPRLKYWLSQFKKPVKKVFLVHGEPEAQDALMHDIEDEQGIEAAIPKYGESINI